MIREDSPLMMRPDMEIAPRDRGRSPKRYSRSDSIDRKVVYDGSERHRRERDHDGGRERGERRYRSRSRSRSRRHKNKYSRSRSRSYGRRSSSHSPHSSRRRHNGTREHPKPSTCLGVFGLSVYTTEENLYHIFAKYGDVERVVVILDAKTGRSRGFGFVYFKNVDEAKSARDHCNGMEIKSKNIRVDFSITDRAHTPTPGVYKGKTSYDYYSRDERYSGGERERYHDREREYYRRHSPSPGDGRRRRRGRSRSRSYSPRR